MFAKLDPVLDKLTVLGIRDHENIGPLKQLAGKIGNGCQVAHLLFIAGFVSFFLLVLNLASFLLGSVIGFVYPAYMSMKAIETETGKDDK